MSDFFDEKAATWDDAAKIERAQAVAGQIAERVPLGPTTRLLEYGAGTGLVTQGLLARAGAPIASVALADASQGMREVMADKVAGGALPADARVWALDLATDAIPDERFDLIVTVQVLHHVTELDRVLAAFADLLEPGGHLCIVDLEAEDGSFHGEGFAGHHGFHRPDLEDALRAAGFGAVAIEDSYRMEKDGRTYPLFLATATR